MLKPQLLQLLLKKETRVRVSRTKYNKQNTIDDHTQATQQQ